MRAREGALGLGMLAVSLSSACGGSRAATRATEATTTEVTSASAPAEAPVTGLFRYVADAATFQECTTGRSYPVSMEADYLNTERAYTIVRSGAPGTPMLIKAFVHVVQRPQVDHPDERLETIIIDRLVETSDDTSACPASMLEAEPR